MRFPGSTLIAWSLAALTVVAGAAAAVLAVINGGSTTPQFWFALPFLAIPPVAGLIAARVPSNPIGWLLLLAAGHITGYSFLQQYGTYGLVTDPGGVPGAAVASWLRTGMWLPAAGTLLVLLPALFPTGRFITPRWRVTGWITGFAVGTGVVALQVAAWPYRGPALLAGDEAWMQQTFAGPTISVIFPVLLLTSVSAIVSLVLRYRRGGITERAQIKWALSSIVAFVSGILLTPLVDELVGNVIAAALTVAIPGSIAVAILRYRLYAIDRVLRRTASYALLTSILVGLYAAGVLGAGAALPEDSGDLAVAASTLGVAALARPLRTRIQRAVDRRFNRKRYDAVRAMEAFGGRLREEVDLPTVLDGLRVAVTECLSPASVGVWLRPRGTNGSSFVGTP